MRQYHLYVRNRRSFEIVPEGVAWGALLLGPLWAAAYGLFFRYIGLCALGLLPIVALVLVNGAVGNTASFLAIILINAAHVFFALKAFEWREGMLRSNGFSKWASIPGDSAKSALQYWSKSDEAKEFLEEAA